MNQTRSRPNASLHQSSLFPDPPSFPLPTSTLARRADPVTSKEAAAALVGSVRLGDDQRHALEMIREYPGRTTHELAGLDDHDDERKIGRRLKALETAGLIYWKGFRLSPMGNRCRLWWPVKGGE